MGGFTGGRVSGPGCAEAGTHGGLRCACPYSEPCRYLPLRLCPGRGWGVCALGLGRERAGPWPGGGRACHLDADEDDLYGGEDELQLRLAEVAHVVAHEEDVEADGAAAEEQQGAWQGRAAIGTSRLPTSSIYPAPQYSPRTQTDPA